MKCRDCIWLCGERASTGIECMNPEKQKVWEYKKQNRPRWRECAKYKAPSADICRYFSQKKPLS